MPSYEVTITRVSKFTLEIESRAALDQLIAIMPPELLDKTHQSASNVVEDIGKKPCRWTKIDRGLNHNPLRFGNRKEMSLCDGDFHKDIAGVGAPPSVARPDSKEEVFVWLRGITLLDKANLRGLVVPHLSFNGETLGNVEFDPKYMVPSPNGVWVTPAVVEHIMKIAEAEAARR
jgi:hypothetical protein